MYISTSASLQEPTTFYDSFSCLQQMKTSFFLSWNGYCKRKYKWCQQLKPLNKQFQALSLSWVSSLFACSLFLAWSRFLADSPCTRVSSEDECPKWKRKATTHVDLHHYWFGIKCYISCTSLNKINSDIKMFPILITRFWYSEQIFVALAFSEVQHSLWSCTFISRAMGSFNTEISSSNCLIRLSFNDICSFRLLISSNCLKYAFRSCN